MVFWFDAIKASESSHSRPFTHFDEVVAKFQRLAFDQHSFSNPDYKPQLQQSINEVFKFNDIVVDEIWKETEFFLNIFNNAFEAHQLHSQHTIYIVEIESSIEQAWNKLIQAQKGFQKAKEKLMLIQGPIKKKTERSKAELVKKEDLLANLNPIQDEPHSTRLNLAELWSDKETKEKNKYFLYASAKEIVQELKGPL